MEHRIMLYYCRFSLLLQISFLQKLEHPLNFHLICFYLNLMPFRNVFGFNMTNGGKNKL